MEEAGYTSITRGTAGRKRMWSLIMGVPKTNKITQMLLWSIRNDGQINHYWHQWNNFHTSTNQRDVCL